jgi:tetratricopeptide (TPR) repeat protein
VAVGLRAASRRLSRRHGLALLAAISGALAVRTYIRNLDWATEQTLMASAAESAPNSFKPHSSLTVVYSGSAAVAEADRTLAILDSLPDERNSVQAFLNVGVCYQTEGDRVALQSRTEAERWYRKSLDTLLRARSIEQSYDRRNQQENLRRGRGKSTFAWNSVYLELGRTYLRLSQPRDALEAFQQGRARRLRPEFFDEISNAYQAMGDSRQAAIALMEGVSFDTSQTQFATKLVDLYRKTEPRSCAVREAGGSRGLDMDCPLVKEHLCTGLRELSRLYAAAGRLADANRSAALASREMGCPAE